MIELNFFRGIMSGVMSTGILSVSS